MNFPDVETDITNFCRLCLKDTEIIRNIFCNDIERNWIENNICSQIYEATNIQVSVNDGPTGICNRCFRTIIGIISFRQKCTKVHEYLKIRCGSISSNTSHPIKNEYKFTGFIDLGKEADILPMTNSSSKNCSEHEYSDYGIPSPILDYKDSEDQCTSDDKSLKIEKSEINPKHRPIIKCKYKLKGGRPPKKLADELPKLKKRDLMETKAYQGLCHLCGREFQHLWVHLRSHSKIPTDTCDICGKGFRSKPNLALHILMHKEAEIPCEICGKRYRTRMRLKRHMRIHTGEKPFSCYVCDKKFYTKYNVDVHMRIHTGEKPYNCSKCGERFTHSYSIKQHMDKFHNT